MGGAAAQRAGAWVEHAVDGPAVAFGLVFRVEPLLLGKISTFLQIALGCAVLAQLSVLPGLEPWVQPLTIVTGLMVIASALAYVHAATRIWSLARVAR